MTASAPYDEHGEQDDVQWIPAPCQRACPVGTDVPSYVALIWEGRYEEAVEVICATNPFSSICGRACSKPCELSCRRGESDAPVAIRNLKRFALDQLGSDYHLPPVAVSKPQTIGIVGGGPTGLTAAQDLARVGYGVHVYEMSGHLGGMMRSIPEFRLPRRIIDDDIERLLKHCPGIEVHLNCSLGDGIGVEELKSRHDAVLLAIGLSRGRRLGIPGESEGLAGLYGIDLLAEVSEGRRPALGGSAAVIGGGNVAMDMARAALRLGARKVGVFCLESRDEMPAWRHEIEDAEKEGIVIHPSQAPKQILHRDNSVAGLELMRCVSVFDGDGQFAPTYDPEHTTTVDADAVLIAIGLEARNDELEGLGVIRQGLVQARFESMLTADPRVFAAGDCAFGPSAIVQAMNHGHRAAYYIDAFLEGQEEPRPYTVAYQTRKVPVAQDDRWETLPLEEQAFHGFVPQRAATAEVESTYDPETARRQAARCLRCDAETGSANYSRDTRELIREMATNEPGDVARLRDITLEQLRPRDNPFPADRPAHIDDLVFLSAALTRLVIDPYREACSTRTELGTSLELKQPFLVTGFDEAPADVRQALAISLAAGGCAYVGHQPLLPGAGGTAQDNGRVPWLQLIAADEAEASADADGLIYSMGRELRSVRPERRREGQLLGLALEAPALEAAIPYALEQGLDLLVLDAAAGLGQPWAELRTEPDLAIMADAIRLLRELGREESIALAYFGGMRSGTDVAKVLAMNCSAAVFGVTMGLVLGGCIDGDRMQFDGDVSIEERSQAVENWIKATAQETAIIARCTGKTNVHNLEPEDMRSITLSTSEALGIPMASGSARRAWF